MNNDLTISLVKLALDASIMRESAIALNIANVNTKNYKPLSVNFEKQLENSDALNRETMDLIKPIYESTDENISLDTQIALSVKNATQYKALIKGLNHKFAIMHMALSGNNAS